MVTDFRPSLVAEVRKYKSAHGPQVAAGVGILGMLIAGVVMMLIKPFQK
jgi:hypothetical protein